MSNSEVGQAVALLAAVTGAVVRPYATVDFGRQQNQQCISALVPRPQGLAFLFRIREHLPDGLVAFIGTTRSLALEPHPDHVELVIGPGSDQFAILEHARTDAANYGLATAAISAKLREFDQRLGITLVHAETDTVEFDLLSAPANTRQFAEELYAFCPDIVEQGVGSVTALAEMIDVTGRVYLWWD